MKKLDKKTLQKVWITWLMQNLTSASYDRLQAFGFCHSMFPIIKELYPNKEERIDALRRHSAFYNTEPQLGCIVNGIVAGLEEKKANGENIDSTAINGIKLGMMGPIAGIGDSMIPGMLVPILLSIGMTIAGPTGNVLGPIFYMIAFPSIILIGSYKLFFSGYKLGTKSLEFFTSKKALAVREALIRFAMFVMGAVGANYVKLSTPLEYVINKGTEQESIISIQSQIDNIFPSLLPLLAILFVYFTLKKGVGPVKMLLIMLAIAIIGVLLHIF